MPLFEGKTPQERYKTIAALALGLIALLFLGRMLFGSSSSPMTTRRTVAPGPRPGGPAQPPSPTDETMPDIRSVPPIVHATFDGTDGGRNIFAFYEPPKKPDAAALAALIPTPTPTPTPPPPLTLSGLTPANVYAQQGDFTLTVTGDKFTAQTRVYMDGQEVPTTFSSAQQLSASVPAALISAPGSRQIMVRTPDGQLYSNAFPLSVGDPPKPQYTYIGLLGGPRYNDKAMLKSPQSNDVVTVQRGDIVGGRFRVTSISERSVDFMDTQLKIKHTLPYVESRGPGGPRPYIPQPPSTADDDDEPQQ
ncbi:MAG: IPT/TIG domain-containing protein [Pyrinomonadaceae bacterium]